MSFLDHLTPPRDFVGSVLPLELQVGVAENAAIFVTHITAYPTGFSFRIQAFTRLAPGSVCRETLQASRDAGQDSDDLRLRCDIEFADGRRAGARGQWISTHGELDLPDWFVEDLTTKPRRNVVLNLIRGGSEQRVWYRDCWVWPLPPAGPLSLLCAWPAAGIPQRRTEIDAEVLRDAAKQAVPLWVAEER
jgi:hypothetical protein